MSKPKCTVYIGVSIDGFIATEDDGLDWLDASGAALDGDGKPDDMGWTEFFGSIDGMIMGRGTYDVVNGMDVPWPYEGKQMVVLSSRPGEDREGVEFISLSPQQAIDHLAAKGVSHIYVDGGKVIRQFLVEDLIDTLTINTVPILLGRGIPLFGNSEEQGSYLKKAKLASSRAYTNGMVMNTYEL